MGRFFSFELDADWLNAQADAGATPEAIARRAGLRPTQILMQLVWAARHPRERAARQAQLDQLYGRSPPAPLRGLAALASSSPRGEETGGVGERSLRNLDWLEEQVRLGRPPRDLAAELGCSIESVRRALRLVRLRKEGRPGNFSPGRPRAGGGATRDGTPSL